MAINKNHEFEELDGIKCAIAEKNVSPERVDFLKSLLELNKYTVVIAATPTPKTATSTPVPPVAGTADAAETANPEIPPPPSSFTIGVTDVTFNPINAIFGRLLKTKSGHTVTLAYWQQKEDVPRDDVPYFDNVKANK